MGLLGKAGAWLADKAEKGVEFVEEKVDQAVEAGEDLARKGVDVAMETGKAAYETVEQVHDAVDPGAKPRGLSEDERKYLHDIYGDSIDYDKIQIRSGSLASRGSSRTIGNTINMQEGKKDKNGNPIVYMGEDGKLTEQGLELLAHESMHAWQYQHGGPSYMLDSLANQGTAQLETGDRDNAYRYEKAIAGGKDWKDWNSEQQAECIEEWNRAYRVTQNKDATPEQKAEAQATVNQLNKYKEQVAAGKGAARLGMDDIEPLAKAAAKKAQEHGLGTPPYSMPEAQ